MTPRPRGRPKVDNPRRSIVSIRGSVEWRDWLVELADSRRLKATDLIDLALVEFAERHGFKKPAPKR